MVENVSFYSNLGGGAAIHASLLLKTVKLFTFHTMRVYKQVILPFGFASEVCKGFVFVQFQPALSMFKNKG